MSARDYLRAAIASGIDGPHTESLLDAFIAEVLNEAANGLAALGLVDSLVSGPQAWTEAIETLRRMASTGQATAPDFYQPGHTYSDDKYGWKFRCDSITTHPEDSERTALGWRYWNNRWEPYSYGEDDWDVQQAHGHTVEETES